MGGESALIPYALSIRQSGVSHMAYRSILSPQALAIQLKDMGFEYVETSCFCTTYKRSTDLLSVEEPEAEIYEDLEIATDFRLSPSEITLLGAWHV